MTLPRQLTLRQTSDGIRFFQAPIDELQNLAIGEITCLRSTFQPDESANLSASLLN